MENTVVVDVKQNLQAMLEQINEQKKIVVKQKKLFNTQRKNAKVKQKAILKKAKEVELKGDERDALISSIEKLMQTRINRDIILVQAEGDSSRYVKCIYKENGVTLDEYLTNLVTTYASNFDSENTEEMKQFVLNKLQEAKVLKKNYFPYSSSITKGYFEEKPCRIFLDDKRNVSRVENEVYLTAEGMNRFRFKELKAIYHNAG